MEKETDRYRYNDKIGKLPTATEECVILFQSNPGQTDSAVLINASVHETFHILSFNSGVWLLISHSIVGNVFWSLLSQVSTDIYWFALKDMGISAEMALLLMLLLPPFFLGLEMIKCFAAAHHWLFHGLAIIFVLFHVVNNDISHAVFSILGLASSMTGLLGLWSCCGVVKSCTIDDSCDIIDLSISGFVIGNLIFLCLRWVGGSLNPMFGDAGYTIAIVTCWLPAVFSCVYLFFHRHSFKLKDEPASSLGHIKPPLCSLKYISTVLSKIRSGAGFGALLALTHWLLASPTTLPRWTGRSPLYGMVCIVSYSIGIVFGMPHQGGLIPLAALSLTTIVLFTSNYNESTGAFVCVVIPLVLPSLWLQLIPRVFSIDNVAIQADPSSVTLAWDEDEVWDANVDEEDTTNALSVLEVNDASSETREQQEEQRIDNMNGLCNNERFSGNAHCCFLAIIVGTYLVLVLTTMFLVAYDYVPSSHLWRGKASIIMICILLLIAIADGRNSFSIRSSGHSRRPNYLRFQTRPLNCDDVAQDPWWSIESELSFLFKAKAVVTFAVLCVILIPMLTVGIPVKEKVDGSLQPWSAVPYQLRMITYNVHQGFNLAGGNNFEYIADILKANRPHFITLQESDTMRVGMGNNDYAAYLSKALGLYSDYGTRTTEDTWGCTVLSAFPITSSISGILPSPSGENACFQKVEIDVTGIKVSIINVHLGNQGTNDNYLQLEKLLEIVLETPAPLIVAGDFNFQRSSHEYDDFLMQSGLYEAGNNGINSGNEDTLEFFFYSGLYLIEYSRPEYDQRLSSDGYPSIATFNLTHAIVSRRKPLRP